VAAAAAGGVAAALVCVDVDRDHQR
jgi:hypothetical protein